MKSTNRAAAKLAKQRMSSWREVACGASENTGEASENTGEEIRRKVRNQILEALPEMVAALLVEARKGSSVHIKLLMQLERDLMEPEKTQRREKNLEEILMSSGSGTGTTMCLTERFCVHPTHRNETAMNGAPESCSGRTKRC